jgi:hypothetical protein
MIAKYLVYTYHTYLKLHYISIKNLEKTIIMIDHFSWRHIPVLASAAPMLLLAGIRDLLYPQTGLLSYGIPEKIARSREAQIVYYGHASRTSTLGLLLFAFYIQGNLASVDTVMGLMGLYCGTSDLILLWKHGNHSVIPMRFLGILFVTVWGFAGMTAGPAL